MEQRLTTITLGVSDLQASADFYEQQLGWKRMPWDSDGIVFFQLNGIILSLFPQEELAADASVDPAGSGFNKVTLAYVTRSEEEVDTLFGQFREQGIRIVKEPEKVFWGGYSGYMADPDGHLWEIAYNPYLKLDEQGNAV